MRALARRRQRRALGPRGPARSRSSRSRRVAAAVAIPVIGMGGIETGADALAFLASGRRRGRGRDRELPRPGCGRAGPARARRRALGARARPIAPPKTSRRPQPEVEPNFAENAGCALARRRGRVILAAADGPRFRRHDIRRRSGEVPRAADEGPAGGRTRSAPRGRSSSATSRAARCKIEKLLLDPPEYVLSAKAFDMILAVPKYGRVKANKILTQCRISPSKTIGGLSERQRGRARPVPAPLGGPRGAGEASDPPP